MGGPKIFASEKKKLMKGLTKEQIQTLKIDNPFKGERNALIRELARRGVAYKLIADITGLKKSSTHRIGTTGINGKSSIKKELNQAVDINRVRGAVVAFMTELQTILDKGAGGDND